MLFVERRTADLNVEKNLRTPILEALRQRGFVSFTEYLEFVEADRSGAELRTLLDVLTTNHTSFLREPEHFEFLSTQVLPALVTGRLDQPIAQADLVDLSAQLALLPTLT